MIPFRIIVSIFIIVFPIPTRAQSKDACNSSCVSGGKTITVQYPFGFSGSCPIQLNCTSNSEIQLKGLSLKVAHITSQSIFLNLSDDCRRPIKTIEPLFSHSNYSPTVQNSLLLKNCNKTQVNDCVLSTSLFPFDSKTCDSNGDNVSCFSQQSVGNKTQQKFLDLEAVHITTCNSVFSSIFVESNGDGSALSYKFHTLELQWWLNGSCKSNSTSICSKNSNCTDVESNDGGNLGFRCSCNNGFRGDGYNGGEGCQKMPAQDTEEPKVTPLLPAQDTEEPKVTPLWNNKRVLVIALVTSFAGIGVLIVIICYFCGKLSSKKIIYFWKKQTLSYQSVEAFLRKNEPLAIRRYSYLDIKKMTNSFKDKLGQGGYGGVYKGKLQDGCFVAVKVLKESKGNGEEFLNEVASISRTSHVNIVTLMGFCFEESKRALIYEFMPNGSLEKFIYKENSSNVDRQLGWETLNKIAVGIAQGLEYLHRGCNARILHFDIKPHNILLDENFCPKISDFGLAKICPREESVISMLGARGTAGYIAPEVFCRNIGGVSHKSDVYSYGMMVLEMVGGRKNIDVSVDRVSEIYFPHWIYKRIELDEELGLQGLISKKDEEIAKKMIIVSLWCIQTDPSSRPSISKVVDMLEGSLDSLQISPKPFLSSPPRTIVDSSTATMSL